MIEEVVVEASAAEDSEAFLEADGAVSNRAMVHQTAYMVRNACERS